MPSSARAATSRWISALAPTSMPRVGSSSSSSLRGGEQPAGQQDLLLVAAGQVGDDRLRVGRADVERLDVLVGELGLLPAGDRPRPAAGRLHRQDDVGADAEVADEPFGAAVLRRVGDALVECDPGVAQPDRLAVDGDRCRCRRGRRRTAVGPSRCGRSRAARPSRAPRRSRIWRSSGATPDLRPRPVACEERRCGGGPSADSRTSCSSASRTASSRPIIFDTSSMRGSSAVRYSPTRRPLRSTVMRSAMRYTWSRKWVMNTTATPDARTRSTTSNSSSTSRVSRLDVGSSRISTWASISIARAIDTSCWTAIECDSSGERRVDVEVQLLEHGGGTPAHLRPVDPPEASRLASEHRVLGDREVRRRG